MGRGRTIPGVLAWLVALAVCTSSGTTQAAKRKNYPLERARAAYQAFEYDRVLPLLEKALERALGPEEEVEIYAFMAEVHVVLDSHDRAADAFVQVLERDPRYRLARYTSPKVRAAFEAAKQRIGTDATGTAAAPPPDQTESSDSEGSAESAGESRPVGGNGDALDKELASIVPPNPDSLTSTTESMAPWYRSWWFWMASAGAAVLIVGTVSAVLVLRQPSAPDVDYGIYPLP